MGTRTFRSDRRLLLTVALIALLAGVLVVPPALATHYDASLEGSFFEIETDANLRLDSVSGYDDWMTVVETQRGDLATGQGDDSFKGGVKEDTACPTETTGSIPNNKSDLKTFGVYQEPGTGSHPGFLHIYWARVQDPSGTTLMDFEFNQSTSPCEEGSRFPQRTVGDLLIEYAIDQGGARANVTIREWDGTAWGPAQDLDDIGAAVGTINDTAIPGSESDIGPLDPRTFGEASIDLDFIFDPGTCQSFGSAYLKSRSSDSFTSQLKDFIAPEPITLTNCGSLLVEKVETGTTTRIAGAEFTVTPGQTNAQGNTATSSIMAGYGTGLFCLDNLLLGVEYTVSETGVPTGYLGAGDQTHTVTDTRTCSVRVAAADDPDLTFENQPLGDLLITKFIDADEDGTMDSDEDGVDDTDVSATDVDGWSFTVKDANDNLVTCSATTTGAGDNSTGQILCEDLVPGDYTVTETQMTGFYNTSPGGSPANTGVPDESATVSRTVSVSFNATTEARFGNTCYQDLTLSVTGVDGSYHRLFAQYAVNGTLLPLGTLDTDYFEVDLTGAGTSKSATVSDLLLTGDAVQWRFGLIVESGDTPQFLDVESISAIPAGWPSCAVSDSVAFSETEVSGTKYKDVDDDGAFDDGSDLPLAGFEFELRASDGVTVIDEATSGLDGSYTFSQKVEPGTYRVYEVGAKAEGEGGPGGAFTDWDQTYPTNPDTYHEITVGLGDPTATVGVFLNAPLGSLSITFTDPTGALADTTIACVDANGDPITDEQAADLVWGATGLRVDDSMSRGTGDEGADENLGITCTITIIDP